MTNRLVRQVERILDEGSGNHRSVIVRMKLPEKDEETILGVVANAIQRRALLLTARDVLPIHLDRMVPTGSRNPFRSSQKST